jgi:hypothetical protein
MKPAYTKWLNVQVRLLTSHLTGFVIQVHKVELMVLWI